MSYSLSIQTEDFSVDAELAKLRTVHTGALVSFVGTVRGANTQALELEHYPGMTEKSIESMLQAAAERFDVQGARVIHRVGRLDLSAQIVLVAVASAHRREAFQAAEFLMDYLKTQAPFWKKEFDTNGKSAWVDARVADDAALSRWGIESLPNK